MPNHPLTDARIRALRSRKSTYHVRDAKLRGFGVRVLPSGAKRFFLIPASGLENKSGTSNCIALSSHGGDFLSARTPHPCVSAMRCQ